MNKFLHNLGVPSDWEVCDIFGFGPDELAIVPRPVASVIMLFPYNDAYKQRKNEEELQLKDKGQEVSDDIYFVKQYVHNACGTMALIHSVANNRDKIQLEDGILKRFLDEGQNMSPSDRGEMLTKAEDIINTHREIAIEGQTQYKQRKNEEELKLKGKGQQVSDDIYYIKQYVHNACGTMALIHSVANNRDKIQLEDGILKRFLDEGQNMSPSDRGEMLTKAEDIINTHREIAIEGQTQPPDPEDMIPYHFVAFVCKDGCLYELDGLKFDPINYGPTTPDSLLEDTVSLIQEKYVVQDPDNIYFTLLALSKCY
ncbi:Peptidase C12, ubiquitin carboxyl-terminal hydrolase [Cinara cedri]|uniref:Ubiquitin carboxyl-terminal hydrolase n=1 Tax=Cinara cedri TaxID=506608 RepID=A0A5E4NNP0_9HEMI|nr:Peptidase C12, ubiquitin carboxyl-terminal hydrolase [Cinara cedri]